MFSTICNLFLAGKEIKKLLFAGFAFSFDRNKVFLSYQVSMLYLLDRTMLCSVLLLIITLHSGSHSDSIRGRLTSDP